jgi:YfiR/HmsC-like
MKLLKILDLSLRYFVARFVACTVLLGVPVLSHAQISEYEIKAAFLFNFALFTQPISTSPPSPKPEISGDDVAYRICIYGKDPFGATIKSLATRKVARRPIVVLQVVTAEELKVCQMVYIGEAEREVTRRAVAAVSGLPIITVAELKEFPAPTVMFNLILLDEKVAFQVNTVAAKNQLMDVSAKLIRLAQNVH